MIDQRLFNLLSAILEAGYELGEVQSALATLSARLTVDKRFRQRADELAKKYGGQQQVRVLMGYGLNKEGVVVGCSSYHLFVEVGGGIYRVKARDGRGDGVRLLKQDADRLYYRWFKPTASRQELVVWGAVTRGAETLSQIVSHTGMAKATAHKATLSLAGRGWIKRVGGKWVKEYDHEQRD